MLTTDVGRKIEANVITDVNANVPAPSSSDQKVLSREAALLFNKSLIARPLMTPEVCSLHIKNTEYAYRWVNRLSQGGRIYQQRKSQGFVNATSEDAEALGGDAVVSSAEITAGDVILMKIRADLYDAAIKYNMEKALTLSRQRGVYLKGASSDVFSDSTPTRETVAQEPFARSGKAQPYIPQNADALVDESISSGRIEGSRKQVSEIREKITAEKSARS
jgi:hypothetical protein